MKLEKLKRAPWLGRFFEPSVDFHELLNEQAKITLNGMEALHSWFANSTENGGQKVRELEREADLVKLELERKLVESFVTPLDREDIYDLSARLDEIINAAKATVREIEAMEIGVDDPFLKEMSEVLIEGTRCIFLAFANLKGNLREAAEQASLSRKSENRFTKVYRQAMRHLFTVEDLKQILRTKEVYRNLLNAAERIDVVGEKLHHVVVKMM